MFTLHWKGSESEIMVNGLRQFVAIHWYIISCTKSCLSPVPILLTIPFMSHTLPQLFILPPSKFSIPYLLPCHTIHRLSPKPYILPYSASLPYLTSFHAIPTSFPIPYQIISTLPSPFHTTTSLFFHTSSPSWCSVSFFIHYAVILHIPIRTLWYTILIFLQPHSYRILHFAFLSNRTLLTIFLFSLSLSFRTLACSPAVSSFVLPLICTIIVVSLSHLLSPLYIQASSGSLRWHW